MVFSYYHQLSSEDRRIYRQSDQVTAIRVPDAEALGPMVGELAGTLQREDRVATTAVAQRLLSGMTTSLGVSSARVRVLACRPSGRWGELHGQYEPPDRKDALPVITLWMRTAKHRRVVAFRTFLRTLIHELCHHLDYDLLKLEDSFHTQGFYKRESSLVHQISRAGGFPPKTPPKRVPSEAG